MATPELIITRARSGFLGLKRWRFVLLTDGEPLLVSVRGYLEHDEAETDARTMISGSWVDAGELELKRSKFPLRKQRWRWFWLLNRSYIAKSSEGYANRAECEEMGNRIAAGEFASATVTLVDLTLDA